MRRYLLLGFSNEGAQDKTGLLVVIIDSVWRGCVHMGGGIGGCLAGGLFTDGPDRLWKETVQVFGGLGLDTGILQGFYGNNVWVSHCSGCFRSCFCVQC